MGFFDNYRFPYFTIQELNLDWLLTKVKNMLSFMPEDGNPGDVLTRKTDGAAWEPPSAVNVDIHSLPQDTAIVNDDELIFYDKSAQANRKITPPDLLDSMSSNSAPLMDGVAAAGTSKKPARYDHVHPTDTTRAPASYFPNQALKVANGGTGANTASGALANLGAMPQNMLDGIIFDFGAGSFFCAIKNSNDNFYIDIPTDCVIPSGKTFTNTLVCAAIGGNNTSIGGPTVSISVSRINAHLLRIVIGDTNNVVPAFYVYSLTISGTISMS